MKYVPKQLSRHFALRVSSRVTFEIYYKFDYILILPTLRQLLRAPRKFPACAVAVRQLGLALCREEPVPISPLCCCGSTAVEFYSTNDNTCLLKSSPSCFLVLYMTVREYTPDPSLSAPLLNRSIGKRTCVSCLDHLGTPCV